MAEDLFISIKEWTWCTYTSTHAHKHARTKAYTRIFKYKVVRQGVAYNALLSIGAF